MATIQVCSSISIAQLHIKSICPWFYFKLSIGTSMTVKKCLNIFLQSVRLTVLYPCLNEVNWGTNEVYLRYEFWSQNWGTQLRHPVRCNWGNRVGQWWSRSLSLTHRQRSGRYYYYYIPCGHFTRWDHGNWGEERVFMQFAIAYIFHPKLDEPFEAPFGKIGKGPVVNIRIRLTNKFSPPFQIRA